MSTGEGSLFSATDVYHQKIIKELNNQRTCEILCDVKLVIGDESTSAHKNVLAAGSPYFSSLFSGNFMEAAMAEVDLSSVADTIHDLEAVIEFLYTGRIKVDKENVPVLIRLASFFLIDELQDICCKFMKRTVNAKTCLRYYFSIVGCGYAELEDKIATLLKARLHDYFIFRRELREISPSELQCLIENAFFELCSVPDVLTFIARYAETGLTEEHISVSCKLLGALDKIELSDYSESYEKGVLDDLQTAFQKLVSYVENNIGNDQGKHFIQLFQEKLINLMGEKVQTDPNKLVSALSGTPNDLRTELSETDKWNPNSLETVQYLEGFSHLNTDVLIVCTSEYIPESFDASAMETERVIDFNVYHIKTRKWYSLVADSLAKKEWLRELINAFKLSNGWKMLSGLGHILCNLNNNDGEIYYHSLDDFSKDTIVYRALNMDVDEIPSFIATDEKTYAVFKKEGPLDYVDPAIDPLKIQFECYELTSNYKWKFLFRTTGCEVDDKNEYENVPFKFIYFDVNVSSVSNEMMIILYEKRIISVFIADLNQTNPKVLKLDINRPDARLSISPFVDECGSVVHKLYVIEGGSRFYCVAVDRYRACIVFQYTYCSGKITPVERQWINISNEKLQYREIRDSEYQGVSFSKGKSVWCYFGHYDGMSALKELVINSDGYIEEKNHTPPPFNRCWMAAVCTVKGTFFTNLKPASRFFWFGPAV